MKSTRGHIISALLGIFIFTAALWVLHHELGLYHLDDIIKSLKTIPPRSLVPALILTVINYLVMTGYDTLALSYIRHPLSYGKIALASFIGYAFSNNVGFSMIAGASVRFRLYSLWGLSTLEITKIIAFCTLTLWLGFFILGGVVFIIEPIAVPEALHLPVASLPVLGALLLLITAGFFFWTLIRKKPFRFRQWEFFLPSSGLFSLQIGIAILDWTLAAGVLYVLLPPLPNLSFVGFIGIFMLAQLAGLISQVPGGIGVFETVALLLLTPYLPAPKILAILLVYRVIYYILPFMTATTLLVTEESLLKKHKIKVFTNLVGRLASGVLPGIISFIMFSGGAILLFSGATPAVGWRLVWLGEFLPLPAIEISHFLGSITGVGLLLLARGLQRRLDSAYILTVALLAFGTVFSMLKGLDYEETIILLIMLAMILPCRRQFYRKAALLGESFTWPWIASISIVLITSIWLGMFSYRHVEYSKELWWRFAFSDDAPRFLRATVGAAAFVLFFALIRLTRPVSVRHSRPGPEDIKLARGIVMESPNTYAHLALLGDKSFLFNQRGNAFIMYAIQGRSWITMGDPVGPEEEWTELIWQFNELCDRHSGRTIFYEVEQKNIHLYLDLGLTLLKIGEEARIPLKDFTLKGREKKGLRYDLGRLEREGCVFEVVTAEGVSGILPELKTISDAWLAEKKTREKGFSIGFFETEYLKSGPVGIVRREGEIIAFANILEGAKKYELSIDLMRYLPGAPNGVMEFLFLKLILLGKEEGYSWFNMGMAPLSGFEVRALSPLWEKFGSFIFHHGERFYNFEGLRQYKNKFGPVWEPKYIASPGGMALPLIFTNLSALISRGLTGVLSK